MTNTWNTYLICGEEVIDSNGAPYLCGQGEDEEIHHPVHGHEFKPLRVLRDQATRAGLMKEALMVDDDWAPALSEVIGYHIYRGRQTKEPIRWDRSSGEAALDEVLATIEKIEARE